MIRIQDIQEDRTFEEEREDDDFVNLTENHYQHHHGWSG